MGYSTRLLYLAPLVCNGEFLEWVTVLSFPLIKSAEDPHANAHLPWQRFEWVTQFSLRSARTSGHALRQHCKVSHSTAYVRSLAIIGDLIAKRHGLQCQRNLGSGWAKFWNRG